MIGHCLLLRSMPCADEKLIRSIIQNYFCNACDMTRWKNYGNSRCICLSHGGLEVRAIPLLNRANILFSPICVAKWRKAERGALTVAQAANELFKLARAILQPARLLPRVPEQKKKKNVKTQTKLRSA